MSPSDANPRAGVGIVLLAAGGSIRMGQPKQLLPYRGATLLRHAAATALATGCQPVVVVLGAEAEACAEVLAALPVAVVKNEAWSQGMAGSLRCGVETLEKIAPETQAALVLLHDQPLITPALLQNLITLWDPPGTLISAAFYSGSPGVPALFDRQLFAELKALTGAEGAKKVLTRNAAVLATLEMPEALADIDSPEDYLRFQGSA